MRLAVKPDALAELAETLDLIAANASGAEFSGTSTILDEGGLILDPLAEPLTVNDVTVNEGSPYAVFTVGGVEGQQLSLELASVSALIGTDTGTQLQIFDGTNWVNYTPGSTVAIPGDGDATPGEPAELLVRIAITNDNPAEGPETFTLTATSGSLSTVGVGTIIDDGTGDLFGPNNKDGEPDQPGENGLPLNLIKDNDLGRNPAVTDVEVNEASPFVVFTVLGVPGAGVTLTLIDGTAEPADHGSSIEVFDPTIDAWVAYDPLTTVMPEDGTLLARVAINNDDPFEGPETVALEATYNANGLTNGITIGGKDAGTATILDDGTGTIFLTNVDDPTTPEDESNLGVNDRGEPEFNRSAPLDDDRSLSVSDVSVNEASPYALFTVSAVEGQELLLDLASGSASLGLDTGTKLQFFDGTNWVDVIPGTPILVPGDGDDTTNELLPLLVRVAIRQDDTLEQAEDFVLTATYASSGKQASGTGTILDDGTGILFGPDNSDGTPDQPGENGLPPDLVLDDDRRAPRLIPTSDGKGLQLTGLPDQQLWVDLSAVLADASLQNGYDLIRVGLDGERSRLGAIGATPDSDFFGDVRFSMLVGEQIRFIQRSGDRAANTQPDVSISGEGNCILVGLDDNGGDGDANDLLLKVKTSRYDPYPLSTQMARHQQGAELAYLDLSWIGAEGITLNLDVQSDCGQRNSIRLVRLDTDADGNPLGTVDGIAPTAGAVFDQAVRANLLSYSYQQSGTQTLEAPPLVVAASDAGIYAPVLITETGTLYTFGGTSSSDGHQHLKVLGANSFAFEDAAGASADNDFNDVVVSFTASDPLSPSLRLSDDGQALQVVAGSGQAPGLWLDLRALQADASRQNSFDLICQAADGSRRQIGSIGATSRGTFFGSKEVFIANGESLHFVQNSNDDRIDDTPALQITKIGERYRIALNDNGVVSGDEDYNDLVIDVDRSPLQPCPEIVKLASHQLSAADGILDLTELGDGGARLQLEILTDCGDPNTLSFVRLATDPLTGEYTVAGRRASEGQAFRDAVRDNLVDFDVTLTGKGTTATRIWQLNQNESGLYAAVLINDDGQLFTFGDGTAVDGKQHLKLLGDSSFGFEDALDSQGSDFDYNDFVVKITPA